MPTSPPSPPARILVIEGNERAAAAIEESLRTRADWQVHRARTLMEAIRFAGEERFQAAILDPDLPDGSGFDILDFLRVGSPGIQILLVSGSSSEADAFHALSHGAGDYLALDHHLDHELPRRLDALLDRVSPESALVDTLRPALAGYEAPVRAESTRADPCDRLDAALEAELAEGTLGIAIYDVRGVALAARLAPELDADGVGFALATLHGQVGALWTYGSLRPVGYDTLVALDGGSLLAATAIPGTYVVAVLLGPGTTRRAGLERLDRVAKALHSALSDDE